MADAWSIICELLLHHFLLSFVSYLTLFLYLLAALALSHPDMI